MVGRRGFLAFSASLIPTAAGAGILKRLGKGEAEPEQVPPDKVRRPALRSIDPTKIGRSITEFGAVGDGLTDNTAAIRRAIREVPDGSTLYIPTGKFRFTQQIVCNRPINWQGEGAASCLWAEQSAWPPPEWVQNGAMLQFGYPYGGFGGQPPRGVHGVSISDFSVRGTGDANPAYALGFFHVMHSSIRGILCNANADRGGTAFAGLNGTTAEIRCDFGGGLAVPDPSGDYLEARPVDVGRPYIQAPYALVDLKFSGVSFPRNGFARKRYRIIGPGATDARVYGNTTDTITVIIGYAGAQWPNGAPTTAASTVRIYDSASARGGGLAQVIFVDLTAETAPFKGRPNGYVSGTDPMNANTFNFILRGNGGNSGAGLLVERQDFGGNNTFTGLYEGFVDTGGRYKKAYGISKYCMKISGAQGFSIRDAHFENAGTGAEGGYTDPCLIIGDRHTATKYFSIGPRVGCDQKILITGTANYFSLLGIRASFLEIPRSLVEGTHWDRNAACEIVNPIIRS